MPYQLLVVGYLLFTTMHSLLTRRYAKTMTLHPLLSGIPTNLTIALPLALLYAVASGDILLPTGAFLLLSFAESMVGSAYGVLSLRAQQYSDAGSFATLIKMHVIIVIAMSSLLLGESLSIVQLIGSGLILLSGFLLSSAVSPRGLKYNAASMLLLAGVVIIGRYLVLQSNVGMTLLFGAIYGLIIKLALQGRAIRPNAAILKSEYKTRAAMSLFQFLQILTFVLAVDLSGNISLVSSIVSLKVVTVMIGSHIFLNERGNLMRKYLAGGISVVGALLLL